MVDTVKLIERINGISDANRPNSFGQFGFDTNQFRHDFDNVLSLKPDPEHDYIYKDKYGHKTPSEAWTSEQYAAIVLSHRNTYCFIETAKTLKQKSHALPDYLFQIATEISESELEPQTELNDTSVRLINLVMMLDIIKSQQHEMPLKNGKLLRQAVGAGIEAIKPMFDDFDAFAKKSYRDLGYFELDPFAKRMSCDRLNKLAEEQPERSLMTIFALNVGSFYSDVFGPRLKDLSILQRQMIDVLAKHDGRMSEQDFVQMAPDDHKSEFLQGLAELLDKKALSSDEGVLSVRGEEFLDWYQAVNFPRRRAKQAARPDPNVDGGPS